MYKKETITLRHNYSQGQGLMDRVSFNKKKKKTYYGSQDMVSNTMITARAFTQPKDTGTQRHPNKAMFSPY